MVNGDIDAVGPPEEVAWSTLSTRPDREQPDLGESARLRARLIGPLHRQRLHVSEVAQMPEFDPKAVPDPRLADPAATDAARPRSRSRPRSPASITPWATVRACL